jgi:hypothetical protein
MSRYKRLPINELLVDERYQRPLEAKRVEKIVKNFDEDLFGALEVSERNGTYAVYDGQHRLVAARKLGMEKVPCLIHSGISLEREAELFVALQQGRKGVNPVEKFRARCFYGDEDAQAIERIISDAGFRVASRGPDAGQAGTIRAVSAVEWIYRRFGGEHLHHTLRTVYDLWLGDQRSTDGYFLQGVADFLSGYGTRLTDESLERLRAEAPTVILRRALGPLQGGGAQARHAVSAELRKVAGVRGRPAVRKGEAV